jgi:hypothetical protein
MALPTYAMAAGKDNNARDQGLPIAVRCGTKPYEQHIGFFRAWI